MRADWSHLERYRYRDAFGTMARYVSNTGEHQGLFTIHAEKGYTITVVAHDGLCGEPNGWEHVSVSCRRKSEVIVPNWALMVSMKQLFWDEDECVVQFHPPTECYVNTHPGVLHLWKQVGMKFPMPPIECV